MILEQMQSKTYRMTCEYSKDIDQLALPSSLTRFLYLHEEALDPWLQHLVKTGAIRLGAQVILEVLPCSSTLSSFKNLGERKKFSM